MGLINVQISEVPAQSVLQRVCAQNAGSWSKYEQSCTSTGVGAHKNTSTCTGKE